MTPTEQFRELAGQAMWVVGMLVAISCAGAIQGVGLAVAYIGVKYVGR